MAAWMSAWWSSAAHSTPKRRASATVVPFPVVAKYSAWRPPIAPSRSSSRATKWVRHSIEGRDSVEAGEFESVHGGFSTQWANAEPNRILPLDVARELEREGTIGGLHTEYFATTGNGTTVADARRFGVEWAAELHQADIQAAILTAT